MKKKIIVGIAVCAALVIVIAGIVYGIKIYQREQDPNWQGLSVLDDLANIQLCSGILS